MKERLHRLSPLILVVEDHFDWNEALQSLLAADGYRTAGARDGVEALMLASLLEPDLILLGMALPVMDGLEFLREYGKDSCVPRPRAPILALSSIPSYLLQAVDQGVAMALESPVAAEQLLDAVGEVLECRTSSRVLSSQPRPRHRIPQSSFRELSSEFLETVVRVFSADTVTFGIARDGVVEYRAGIGARGEACLKSGQGLDSPCQLVMASGQWLGVGDLSASPLLSTSRWKQESGMRAYAGAPLLASDGAIVGTLALHFVKPRIHAHSEKRLLLAFAELASSNESPLQLSQEFRKRILPALVARSISTGEPLPISVLGDEIEAWSLIRDLELLGEMKITGTGIAA
jgi:CheY-like chemotaxis protein